jgi:hypothetical protein
MIQINLPDKMLEGGLEQEKIGRLLVPADLTESNSMPGQ